MLKKFLVLIFATFSITAFAETGVFTVEGMHCEACAKGISKKVCAANEYEKCEVEVGKMTVVSKAGQKLDPAKIQADLEKAGSKFKITNTEIK
jgi:copper chaperone CopZ